MFIAQTQDKIRISAETAYKDIDYYCPVCGEKVRLRCGSINAPHFAHIPGHDCTDTWHYDMSEWHLEMQNKFDEKCREVVVTHNGITHRADILKDGVVIEFQHSPISEDEIRARNEFYCAAGYKVAWVFDVRDKKEYFSPNNGEDYNLLRWNWPLRCLRAFTPRANSPVSICLDFDDRKSLLHSAPDEVYDDIKRVNWSSEDYSGVSDFRYIAVDDGHHIELGNDTDLEELFRTPAQRLQTLLNENRPYSEKCERVKGFARQSYICPQDGQWIHGRCFQCRYNIASEYHSGNYKKEGIYHYCKYSDIPQRDKDSGIPEFNT